MAKLTTLLLALGVVALLPLASSFAGSSCLGAGCDAWARPTAPAISRVGARAGLALRATGRQSARRAGTLGLSAQDEGSLRPGKAGDAEIIKKMVLAESMNPLFLDPVNFVIAEEAGEILGIGQIRKLDRSFELASLVVKEEMRGNGIGSAIVKELLDAHQQKFETEGGAVPSVLALCLKDTAGFYQRLGFAETPMNLAPKQMQMEAGAGNLLVGLTKGSSLVCLKYKFPVRELNCDNSGTVLRNVGPGEGSG